VLAVCLSAAIHMVAVLVPGLRPVFRTFELTGAEWGILLVLSASILPVIEGLKLLQRVGFIGKDLGPMSRRSLS
jgi:Ca2+-transporting ATPase